MLSHLQGPQLPTNLKIVPVHEQTPPKEYLSSSSSQTDWGNGSLLFFAKTTTRIKIIDQRFFPTHPRGLMNIPNLDLHVGGTVVLISLDMGVNPKIMVPPNHPF